MLVPFRVNASQKSNCDLNTASGFGEERDVLRVVKTARDVMDFDVVSKE